MKTRFEKPRAPSRRFYLWVASVFLLASLLRLPYLVKYHYALNFDEAVIGVMAQDILEGKGIPLFFYGQNYFGPLEALFALPFQVVFPASSWALRTSIMILTFLSLAFFWQGLRLLLSKSGGWIFLFWAALSPLVLTIRSVHPSGHMGGLFCGGTVFYLAARIGISLDRPKPLFFCWGLVSGLGLWMHPGTLIYILASAAMILWQDFRSLWRAPSSWAVGLVGGLTGGLPFWIKSGSLKFQTFHFGQPRLEHLSIGSFVEDLGRSLGHMGSFLGTDLFTLPLAAAAWAGMIALLIYSLFLLTTKTLGEEREKKGALLFAWAIMLLTLFAYNYIRAHRFGYISYRYYLPILIGLGMIFQITLDRIGRRSSRARTVWALFLVSINLAANLLGFQQEAYFRYQFNLQGPYIRWIHLPPYLQRHGIDRAYVDLFAEGPLNFIFRGKKFFSDFYDSRYPDRSLEVDAASHPAFIIPDPQEADLFQQGLAALGSERFVTFQTPAYRIFHHIETPVNAFVPIERKAVQVLCHPHPEQGRNLLDRHLQTLWSTGKGQDGSEVITLDLRKAVPVNRVDLVPLWLETFPRRVSIETSIDYRTWIQAVDLPTSNTLFWVGPHPAYKVWEGFFQYIFPSRQARYIRIRQKGCSPDPWELSEIVLYAPGPKLEKGPPLSWDQWIAFLKEQRISEVVSDLYCAANLVKHSGGAIRATVRFNHAYSPPSLQDGLSHKELQAVAVHRREEAGIQAFLDQQGWRYRTKRFGEYALYYHLEDPLSPRKAIIQPSMMVTASHNPSQTPLMTDHDPKTRWTTWTPQQPAMFVRCDFPSPLRLSGIVLDPGPFIRDVPPVLDLFQAPDGIHFQKITSAYRFFTRIRWTGSHLFGNDTSAVYLFPELTTRSLKIVCPGNSPTFYWSIAELILLQGDAP